MYITAKVIADSVANGYRVTTLELEYPRYIHSEFMTHRVFSRNAASSRAIPFDKMLQTIVSMDQTPKWTLNQKGMVGIPATTMEDRLEAKNIWRTARDKAIEFARRLKDLGIHKQNYNRLLEPFQTMKTIVTATEWDNFFKLRIHPNAQPEIQELASVIKEAIGKSTPYKVADNEIYWHTPYISLEDARAMGWEKAKKISASCCAQVSYRNLDTSEEKAMNIFHKLVSEDIIHGSAFEHVCRPLSLNEKPLGNLVGWHQYRHDIENGDI